MTETINPFVKDPHDHDAFNAALEALRAKLGGGTLRVQRINADGVPCDFGIGISYTYQLKGD